MAILDGPFDSFEVRSKPFTRHLLRLQRNCLLKNARPPWFISKVSLRTAKSFLRTGTFQRFWRLSRLGEAREEEFASHFKRNHHCQSQPAGRRHQTKTDAAIYRLDISYQGLAARFRAFYSPLSLAEVSLGQIWRLLEEGFSCPAEKTVHVLREGERTFEEFALFRTRLRGHGGTSVS